MTPISYIVSRTGTINAVVNGKSYTVPPTHRNYDRARNTLKDQDGEKFLAAVDFTQVVHRFVPPTAARRVEVKDGQVWHAGRVLHNAVTRRILELAEGGWPYDPVVNFLDNVESNPSYRAVQELYTFLEHRALPLTDNGHFLAYKAVRHDWLDKHSETFDNRVGKVVSVPRNTVNDDFREGCSNGLHVGSIEYVQGFKGEGDHVVICRVNPRDVVSVPLDSNCTKLRCCEYEVVGEYAGDLTGLVYTSQGDAVPPPSRNDPAQGVTQAPPPRDGEKWEVRQHVPDGKPGLTADEEAQYDEYDRQNKVSDYTDDDSGVTLPGDERNALDDDNFGSDDDSGSGEYSGSSDVEGSDFDSDFRDYEDEEDDSESTSSEVEVTANLDGTESLPPLAEPTTDPADALVDTGYGHDWSAYQQ